jgi:hypothetical protein
MVLLNRTLNTAEAEAVVVGKLVVVVVVVVVVHNWAQALVQSQLRAVFGMVATVVVETKAQVSGAGTKAQASAVTALLMVTHLICYRPGPLLPKMSVPAAIRDTLGFQPPQTPTRKLAVVPSPAVDRDCEMTGSLPTKTKMKTRGSPPS